MKRKFVVKASVKSKMRNRIVSSSNTYTYQNELDSWECKNGDIITAYDLGRDGGADIIATDAQGNIIAYVSCDDGDIYEDAAKALDGYVFSSAEDAFDGWENGMGGSPFDSNYFPDDVNVIN